MTKKFWKTKLEPWLVPDELLNKQHGEEIFGIKEQCLVEFWIEGGFKITGDARTLSVNFNDPKLLILAVMIGQGAKIHRIPYDCLVCFVSIRIGNNGDEEETAIRRSQN